MNKRTARTKHKTPFAYKQHEPGQWTIFDANGAPVAVCPGNESHVEFLVVACNNYAPLKKIARLARGEIESDIFRDSNNVSQNAMQELFQRLDFKVLCGK